MLLAARNAMLTGGEKRSYDAEVEYIEGTGNQYILGLADKFYDYEIGVQQTRMSTSTAASSIISVSRGYRLYSTVEGSNSYYYMILGSGNYLNSHVLSTTYADISLKNGVFKVNDETIGTITPVYYVGSLCLLAMNNVSAVFNEAKIYYLKLYDELGALISDFIPVRIGSGSSAVGYLYDRSNPTGGPTGNGLYPNSGTGAFVVGPDK